MRKSLILCLMLSGCMTYAAIMNAPGTIHEKVSQIDNVRTLYMIPAYVYKENPMFSVPYIRLGLFWSDRAPDMMLMDAWVPVITSIPAARSLRFNIDGEVVELSDTEPLMKFSGPSSYRTYAVERSFVEKLVKAKRVVVGFCGSEAIFSQDTTQSARPAFIEFLQKTAPVVSL